MITKISPKKTYISEDNTRYRILDIYGKDNNFVYEFEKVNDGKNYGVHQEMHSSDEMFIKAKKLVKKRFVKDGNK